MSTATWFLESVAPDGSMRRHRLDELPFNVGRDAGNHLVIEGMGLSRHHAVLEQDITGRLRLTDCDSTNGTQVNHELITGSRLLDDNDVLHFGHAEYRLGREAAAAPAPAPEPLPDGDKTQLLPKGARRSEHFVPLAPQFMAFLAGQGLTGALQPIVDARRGLSLGAELLGRSTHPELPRSPVLLFGMAERLQREAELSRAFRRHGLTAAMTSGQPGMLFVNTHPVETFTPGLLEELADYRQRWPQLDLVVEVHETAVVQVDRMRELAAALKALGVRFAYDDFGAGQSRLNELGEVTAHVIKFDMALIRDLDRASDRKRRLVQNMVHTVHDLDAIALAEGVETAAEADVVRSMGFDLIQGYLTGKPVLISGG